MNVENFIHPTDKALTEKILQTDLLSNWLRTSDDLDETCAYFYASSMPEIVDDLLNDMMIRACEEFEVATPRLYLTRSYDYDIACVGINSPVVLVPAVLKERGEFDIIQGRLYAAAGAIAAHHPKFDFLIRAFENLQGFPVLNSATTAILYEWRRARVYTLDRAFFLATEDFELAMKNIFYGVVPFEWLENFHFNDNEDTFLEQTERYMRNENPAQILGKFYGVFMDFAWLPKRCVELKDFIRQRRLIR